MNSSPKINNSFQSIGEDDPSIHPSKLSLRLTLNFNSIKYFVYFDDYSQLIYFGEYTLYHVQHVADLMLRLDAILEKDELLQKVFRKVTIGVESKTVLVPTEIVARFDSSTFLPCSDKEELLKDTFAGRDYALYYSIDKELKAHLAAKFPSVNIRSLSSPLLKLLPESIADNTPKLFVNVASDTLEVLYFEQKDKLLLHNKYEYHTPADFIYFVLLVADQFAIDREQTELVLLGEVNTNSQIYEITYRYFRHVTFQGKPSQISFARVFEQFPKHLHFNLYNLEA